VTEFVDYRVVEGVPRRSPTWLQADQGEMSVQGEAERVWGGVQAQGTARLDSM
jgi:hypothetical protein